MRRPERPRHRRNQRISSRGRAFAFCKGDQKIEVSVRPKLITNNAQVLINALKTGKGVGTTQVLLVADELKSGALIRVLPEYEIEPTEFFLVYPSSKFLRPTVRAFIDFAVPALQCIEGIY